MYPKRIMNEVTWGFAGDKYSSIEEFIKSVNEYYAEIGSDVIWDYQRAILECKEVTIQYAYWNEEEEDEVEEDFTIVSNQSSFTEGELLFKIHNEVVDNLKNDDKHFFEGLILWEGENIDNPSIPLYFLDLGS